MGAVEFKEFKMASTVKIKEELLGELFGCFLANIPVGEPMALASQLEQAHWHYLDLMRPDDPSLPACSLKEFTATVLQYSPSLTTISSVSLIDQWKSFKHTRPVRGAILLNTDLTKCVLVQGYPSSTSWSFPKGKKENGETDLQAAVREVYEEVGFRINDLIKESWYLEVKHKDLDSRMYIITDISEATHFEPVARKEISKIKWFNLKDLPSHKHDETSKNCLKISPNKFYTVVPYIGPLRQWIAKHKKRQTPKKAIVSSSLILQTSPYNNNNKINSVLPSSQFSLLSSSIHSSPSNRSHSPLQYSTPNRYSHSSPLLYTTPHSSSIQYNSTTDPFTTPTHPQSSSHSQYSTTNPHSHSTNPHSSHPHSTNPHSTNSHSTNPHSTNPHSTNSHSCHPNPHSTNPHSTNPHSTNPHSNSHYFTTPNDSHSFSHSYDTTPVHPNTTNSQYTSPFRYTTPNNSHSSLHHSMTNPHSTNSQYTSPLQYASPQSFSLLQNTTSPYRLFSSPPPLQLSSTTPVRTSLQYNNPLQLLISANILRPCQTWQGFKFDMDAIIQAHNGSQ